MIDHVAKHPGGIFIMITALASKCPKKFCIIYCSYIYLILNLMMNLIFDFCFSSISQNYEKKNEDVQCKNVFINSAIKTHAHQDDQ